MKIFAVILMLYAIFLLHRIAFPKSTETKKDEDTLKREPDISQVVVKNRFVRPNSGQPQPTRTAPEKDDVIEKKPDIFVGGNENRSAVIPNEKLDEVFDETNPDELDIEPDEDEKDDQEETVDLEDEAAELESGAEFASGMSIEEMVEAAKAIDKPSDDKAEILLKVEKTDMFEKLVSGDEGKAERIKAIIDRHIRSLQPEEEIENSDWNDFDIRNHLSKTIKKKTI